MNQEIVDKIVAAVLYEGYVLYPYRPSVKNHHRWTFGGIYPRAYSEKQHGSDPWTMQTQCLICASAGATVQIRSRFLHLMMRHVERACDPAPSNSACFEPVPSLQVQGQIFQTWQEAVEREVTLEEMNLGQLSSAPQTRTFSFPASSETVGLRESDGRIVGRIIRRQRQIDGAIEVSAEKKAPDLYMLTVRLSNLTALGDGAAADGPSPGGNRSEARDDALLHALVSTHAILGVRNGAFVSLTDPPPEIREHASACVNVGCWPVLVGEAGETDTMLASPIILYDYPQVAPESPGDLFDGLEIDEILTLRILTLTDEEKRQASAVDSRVRDLLSRTSALASEQLFSLHGMVRGVGATGQPAVTGRGEYHAALAERGEPTGALT
ncbi:MAG TPA: hypothetical protein VG326_04430 [Tepidisphaeraceae bacterium]|jgi:hydrogenase maturation protease|nr:hypothetical protein [Tepidisphaeraceae bacterium]